MEILLSTNTNEWAPYGTMIITILPLLANSQPLNMIRAYLPKSLSSLYPADPKLIRIINQGSPLSSLSYLGIIVPNQVTRMLCIRA